MKNGLLAMAETCSMLPKEPTEPQRHDPETVTIEKEKWEKVRADIVLSHTHKFQA